MVERKYRAAVSELERLVVMRLFELTKLGMSGVGVWPSTWHKFQLISIGSLQITRPDFEGTEESF